MSLSSSASSATAAPSGGTPASPPTRPGLRDRVRNALLVVVSMLVLLGGVLYVVTPSAARVELSIGEVSSPLAYERDLTPEYSLVAASAQQRRYRQVFYGEITSPQGVPVRKARLDISGVTRRTHGFRARVQVGGTGTYRAVVRLKPGRYEVTVRLLADGKPRSASKRLFLRNKRAYAVSLKVRESGFLALLPISSY